MLHSPLRTMASSINDDTLSTLNSGQFDDLSFIVDDHLDAELESLDKSSASSRKHQRHKKATELWSYAREHKDNEQARNKWGHDIWYCGQTRGNSSHTRSCMYSTTTLKRARDHLGKDHLITLSEDSQPLAKRQATLLQGFKKQQGLPPPQFSTAEKELLRRVINKEEVNEKLVRLLASNNQSLRSVEWAEFIEFCNTLNPFAGEALPNRKKAKETLVSINRKYVLNLFKSLYL